MVLGKFLVEFINNHDDLINHEDWVELFGLAWEEFGKYELSALMEALYTIADKDTIQLASIHAAFMQRVDYELDNDLWTDAARSWSRLDWMLDAIPLFDQEYDVVRGYIFTHSNEMGLTLRPLDQKYWWSDQPDFDLGWFKEKYFEVQ